MIYKVKMKESIELQFDNTGIREAVVRHHSVFIKINMARPAEPGHPRTDPLLLSQIIHYISLYGGSCTIGECANGYLRSNLEHSGLGEVIEKYKVQVIDLDNDEVDKVVVNSEEHFLPKLLKNFGVRIGIPATSKRPEMIFSNNVKLFVGIVPRRMYQIGDTATTWRPRVHVDLHTSVANIFQAVHQYAPFDFFINGGMAMDEQKREFMMTDILVGDNAIELDMYVLQNHFPRHKIPEYLQMLIGGLK